jgi:tRNA-dihydrouridine synthase B
MKDFQLMFAPMELQSTPPLRKKCFEAGADVTFTEMARVSALVRKNKSTVDRLDIPEPIPTYIQLSCNKENELDRFLSTFKPQEGFLGFNLNLGCPSPDLIKRGLGCALIKRTAKVQKMLDVIRKYGYSASLKLRLGMNGFEKENKVYLNLISGTDADFYIVHARHGKERDKNPSDFSVYKGCVETGKVIIANGDVATKAQVDELKAIGVKGVMIGRAAVANPEIFKDLK